MMFESTQLQCGKSSKMLTSKCEERRSHIDTGAAAEVFGTSLYLCQQEIFPYAVSKASLSKVIKVFNDSIFVPV
jgi:hypothetical protein